ncbi:MAG TPA: PEP-CTERM sorting domain-containing protein, partial [Fimbriimonas sp.]|nr:PEP-CTERM sorting domain-containing protein [Fimbriimonas sp.]
AIFVGSFVLTASSAHALTLNFSDLLLVAGTHGTEYTTSTVSAFGPLDNAATISYTMTTSGATWHSDLIVKITDPTGSVTYSPLPGAPNGAGAFSAPINFGSASPSNGTYSIGFTNTFATGLDVALSNIQIEVTQSVPEPATMTALAVGGLALLRRRKTK